MKFLVDAGLPPWVVQALVAEGYDAVHADDAGIGHAPDELIAERARGTDRCIITRDYDFADVRNYDPRRHHGIIVLFVPRDRGSPYMRLLLAKLFDHLRAGGVVDRKLLIVEAERIRTRG